MIRNIFSFFFVVYSCIANAQEAPLGLKWGMSSTQAASLGLSLTGQTNGQFGVGFEARNTPKNIADAHLVMLYFGFDDRLYRILIASNLFVHDEDGQLSKSRFDAVKRSLTEKYGYPKVDQNYLTTESFFQPSRQYSYAIFSNHAQRFCNFDNDKIFVQLSIQAVSTTDLYYRIIYEDKTIAIDENKKAAKTEQDAL